MARAGIEPATRGFSAQCSVSKTALAELRCLCFGAAEAGRALRVQDHSLGAQASIGGCGVRCPGARILPGFAIVVTAGLHLLD